MSASATVMLATLGVGCGNHDPDLNSIDNGPLATQGNVNVSGGVRSASSSYQLVTTTGQAPGGNGVIKSTNYQLVFGFVGTASQAQ